MAKYVLGCIGSTTELTVFENEADADWRADEWVTVEADSLDEAKEQYETAFAQWQEQNEPAID